jgi:DNA-binding transcriptional regulator GbsR (MarR family)
MTENKRSGAVGKVFSVIGEKPMTIQDIKSHIPELTDGQISMSLVYLRDKKKVIQATKVPRTSKVGRKEINAYVLSQAA